MELSKRLKAAIMLVDRGANVADIGTDHGYVPIYLKKNNIAHKVIAMDVRSGPLSHARENTLKFGLEGKIDLRLSDGLEKLAPYEVDTVIIGGMGGDLVLKILTDYKEVTRSIQTFILQPQSEIKRVRKFLSDHHFVIVKEDMVFEDGKYYPLIKAIPSVDKVTYQEEEYKYGPCLLKEKHEVLYQFLVREKRVRGEILDSLKNSNRSESKIRASQVEKEKELIIKAMDYYQ